MLFARCARRPWLMNWSRPWKPVYHPKTSGKSTRSRRSFSANKALKVPIGNYRSKAFSSRSRCLFIAALLSQSSCKLWLILFTRSSSAFLSAKCLERTAWSASIHNTGKGRHQPWELYSLYGRLNRNILVLFTTLWNILKGMNTEQRKTLKTL